mgnify:CR=1 FL=1|tara:strand:- start:14 stop:481 length:468 start_codon:yes stop_codon:yes gene_type:complete
MSLLGSVIVPSIISALGWGISPILHKLNMNLVKNNYLVVFILHCFFIGVLGVLLGLSYYSKLNNFTKNPKILLITIYGILGAFASVILGYYFYFKALAKTNNTLLVILIVYIVPLIFSTLLSSIILKEKINLGMIFGLLVSIIGIGIFGWASNHK